MAAIVPKKYDFKTEDSEWQQIWQQQNVYAWDKNLDRSENYVIDTPPPTVSGELHLGHIYSYTQTDIIARYQRAIGKNVFYPIGFDDNGLPTERLVEKRHKVKASQMKRADFIELCQQEVIAVEEEYRKLFKAMGLSFDWQQEYQTISINSRKLSQLSFLDLVDKDLIYRNLQPTLWDPTDQTALAQADIEDKTKPTIMVTIPFTSATGEIMAIATTRPEMLPACVAVFYHPDDGRYQSLAGQYLYSPIFKAQVPCLADDKVDQDKGSGLVMCCTFGDNTDVYWWRTHKLALKQLIDRKGIIKPDILEFGKANWQVEDYDHAINMLNEFTGLYITKARDAMITKLSNLGLILASENIEHSVKCAERSGTALEILVTPQWNVKLLEHKTELLNLAKSATFYPDYMGLRLQQWIEGLQWDWCISRQRYFGVPFPAWYSKRAGEEGKVIFANPEQLPVDPLVDLPAGYDADEVTGDPDVMDTWATSAITPQLSSYGLSDKFAIDKTRHKKLFPADLRPQAHEIIRTWTFYTLAKSYFHSGKLPWQNLLISGWCLAADKAKMSKSKGNVVTPWHLIDQYGADVIRFWAANSKPGADIIYNEEIFKLGKKFTNKLWNAAKLVALHISKLPQKILPITELLTSNMIDNIFDKWLLHKLHLTIVSATSHFDNYDYCAAKSVIEKFFWEDFCDDYLEISKTRAYNENGQNDSGQLSACFTLYHCFNILLRLLAPFTPHITASIQKLLYPNDLPVYIKGAWPEPVKITINDDAYNVGETGIEILNLLRKFKSAENMSPKAPIAKLAYDQANPKGAELTLITNDLAAVMNIGEISAENCDSWQISSEISNIGVNITVNE